MRMRVCVRVRVPLAPPLMGRSVGGGLGMAVWGTGEPELAPEGEVMEEEEGEEEEVVYEEVEDVRG